MVGNAAGYGAGGSPDRDAGILYGHVTQNHPEVHMYALRLDRGLSDADVSGYGARYAPDREAA